MSKVHLEYHPSYDISYGTMIDLPTLRVDRQEGWNPHYRITFYVDGEFVRRTYISLEEHGLKYSEYALKIIASHINRLAHA